MMEKSLSKSGMSGSTLKLIAIFCMLLDHIASVVLELDPIYSFGMVPQIKMLFNTLGRISFPIFAFLIVEGFVHTSNIKKYIVRLFAFAIISELPFNLAFSGEFSILSANNVFYTLAIGLLTVYVIDKFNKSITVQLAITFAMAMVTAILGTDYSFIGIFIIVGFYIFREDKAALTICMSILFSYMFVIKKSVGYLGMFLSLPLILSYNGEKGLSLKYVFYVFYPVHLIILFSIAQLFN